MDKAFCVLRAFRFVFIFILVTLMTYIIMKTFDPNFSRFTSHFIKRKKSYLIMNCVFSFKDIVRAIETRDNKIIQPSQQDSKSNEKS